MKTILFALLFVASLNAQAFCPNKKLPDSMDKGIDYLLCGKADKAIDIFKTYVTVDNNAQYYLGKAYLLQSESFDSEKLKKPALEQAVQWLLLAANKNHSLAEYAMGRLYHKGLGVPSNEILAEKWMEKAANHGHTPAQVELASMYATAKGSADIPDFINGYAWLNIAAAMGNDDVKDLLKRVESHMSHNQVKQAQVLSKKLQKKIR